MPTARTDAHWAAYNDHQTGREVRPLCDELIALAGEGGRRFAIDFGCGAGVETRALLRAGWHVYAIDGAPGTRQRVLTTTEGSDQARLTIEVSDFHDLAELPAADLVYAGYSLAYIHPRTFPVVWSLIRASLRPGAWLAVNFFGERDSWAANPEETFLSEARARALFDGLDIVSFSEQDEDGPAYGGPKHWHVFNVIARRPLSKT
jgi:trans-aconitate methyltransferase